jgi:hypothetical protein
VVGDTLLSHHGSQACSLAAEGVCVCVCVCVCLCVCGGESSCSWIRVFVRSACIKQWLAKHKTCPICRFRIED